GCDGARAPDSRPLWPALSVQDLAGRPATLPGTSKGARVINLWALWCPPCRRELPSLERLTWALAPDAIDVNTVALAEDSFPVREYLAQHAPGLHGVILSPRTPVVQELGLQALPQTFLVAPDGRVLARWVGAREWDSQAVRDELDRLLQTS
ncbi:MAG: TlpA family protein disulfide reductase, partial [Burkholderiaceae bacterium]